MDRDELNNKTDEELVTLCINKPDSYLYLMKRYEGKLMRYIRRISNITKEDAEDILQEVFVSTYRNLHGFDTGLKFSSWIYRIAHNHTISHFRKLKTRPNLIDLENEELIDRLATHKEMEIEINGQLEKEKIIEIINSLDIKYKSILILRFIEEKEYSEISDILKMPINTVGTQINRAKKIVRDKLSI